MAKQKNPTLDEAERYAVASLIREHLRTTRNVLADHAPLKSAYSKLAPADDPPPTPRITVRPLGMTPGRRRALPSAVTIVSSDPDKAEGARTYLGRWKERWRRRREEKEQRRIQRKKVPDAPLLPGDHRVKSEWYRQ